MIQIFFANLGWDSTRIASLTNFNSVEHARVTELTENQLSIKLQSSLQQNCTINNYLEYQEINISKHKYS